MPVVFKNKQYANAADQYDSGESTSDSIKPVSNGETVTEGVLTRPSENLRLRTEELKRNVQKYETILQSAGFLSYSYNEAVAPAAVRDSTVEIEWVEADSAFYVRPSANSVLTILGAVVPGMKYAIDRSAFVSFYGSNVSAGNNPKLGLQNPGDSLSFRLPMLSAADAASNPLALIGANTSNPAIDSAVFDTTLYDLVSDPISGASGDSALFKSPSKYKLKITVATDANGAALKAALAGARASNSIVKINVGAVGYNLDASSYLVDPDDSDIVYLLEDNRAYFPFATVDNDDFIVIGASSYYGSNGAGAQSWSTIEVETEGAPPEEFLIPIASYTGTKIIIHGIGSVDEDDVKNAANSTLTLSNTGVASTELGGAIESYESTFRLSNTIVSNSDIKNDTTNILGFRRLFIPISLDIPEIPTGRKYYLDKLEVFSDQNIVTGSPVNLAVSIAKYSGSVSEYDDIAAISNIELDLIGSASNIFAAGAVTSDDVIASNAEAIVGFYEANKVRTYNLGSTSTGNLTIETEADRDRTSLLVLLGRNGADITSASFDLFFRLTFKTIHGNELPLLASYVPSAP